MPPTYLPLGTTPLPSQPQVQGSQAERKVSTCGDGDLHLCQVQGSQAERKVSPAVMGTCSSARRYERLSEVVELLFPPVAPAQTWPTLNTATSATGGSRWPPWTSTPWPEPASGCPPTMAQPRTDCVSQGVGVVKPGAHLANLLKGRRGAASWPWPHLSPGLGQLRYVEGARGPLLQASAWPCPVARK